MRFHLTSFFINIILIFFVLCIFMYVRSLMVEMYFLHVRNIIYDLTGYLAFIFSWISTLAIYKINNIKLHFYYFLGSNILVVFLLEFFGYLNSLELNSSHFVFYNLYLNLKYAIKETIIPITIISKFVSTSQNYLGKKLLPTRYCQKRG